VAPDRRPLERVAGPKLGEFVQTLHEQHGVVFDLGGTASGLVPGAVVLQSGERLDADFLPWRVGPGRTGREGETTSPVGGPRAVGGVLTLSAA
jgi:hypothetical protein